MQALRKEKAMRISFCCEEMAHWITKGGIGKDVVFLPDDYGEQIAHNECPHCGAPIEITMPARSESGERGEGGDDAKL